MMNNAPEKPEQPEQPKKLDEASQGNAQKLKKEAEDLREVLSDVRAQQGAALEAARARVEEIAEEDNAVSTRKISLPLRIFGALCIAAGVLFVPTDVLLVWGFVNAVITKDWSTFFEVTVSNQFMVLNGIEVAAYALETVLFMVLGFRLVRNKRTGAGRLSLVAIVVTVADMLLSIMGHGFGLNVITTGITLVFLVVMYTTLDPALHEERVLQRKLKALEDRSDQEEGTLGRDKTGAGYLRLDFFNIFWLFVIASVVGLMVESAICPFLNGRIENRTGMLWGPFSPIYGVGAVLMVVALNRFWNKHWIIVYGVSALIGGAFEYLASWFFQFAFGISAWDYSTEPFNIDGRTDLVHMLCWGAMGLVFIKFLVPKVLDIINLIPWNLRYIVTVVCASLMIFNSAATMLSFECWYMRMAGNEPTAPVEKFFAEHFDDDFMKHHFATMSIDPNRATRN